MRDVTESPIAGYFVGRARFPKEKARFVSWLALVAQEQPGNVTRRLL
jgi:succinyl-CoA synthetase alpha subunit